MLNPLIYYFNLILNHPSLFFFETAQIPPEHELKDNKSRIHSAVFKIIPHYHKQWANFHVWSLLKATILGIVLTARYCFQHFTYINIKYSPSY